MGKDRFWSLDDHLLLEREQQIWEGKRDTNAAITDHEIVWELNFN